MSKKPVEVNTPPDSVLEGTGAKEFPRISNEELKLLLDRCLHKDEKAWEAVFTGLYGLVKDVVLRTGLRDDDVEDAIADSFYKMVYFIEDVAHSRQPVPYIGALARYTAIGIRQRQERRPTLPIGSLTPEESSLLFSRERGEPPKQGVTIMATQLNEGLLEAVDQLRPEERRLIRLKYIRELCYDEVAYIVGKDVGTTRVATHRAVRKLKELIRPDIRDMVGDVYDLWNRLAVIPIQEDEAPLEDQKTLLLLEDYVADRESLSPPDVARIEKALKDSIALRERKVILERMALVDEDVSGHAAPDRIPRALLRRLMDEVRSLRP